MNTATSTPISSSSNSTVGLERPAGAVARSEVDVYRSVSRAGVASCVLGLFGLAAFATPFLTPLPLTGLVFAFLAFSAFRRYPEELVGRPVALLGGLICGGSLVLAPAWHAYVYATEVPEGYTRVNFASLMSPTGAVDRPPEEALALDGQAVFIKGYIHPSSMDTMMSKRFIIVPDLGTCCFGGQPPLTHMIEVNLTGKQYATKNMRQQRLAGTLHVNRNLKPVDGLTGVYYQLRADILK